MHHAITTIEPQLVMAPSKSRDDMKNAQLVTSEMPTQSLPWRLIRAVNGMKPLTADASGGGQVVELPTRAPAGWTDPAELQRRIILPWNFASPELQERIEIISEFEALVRDGAWDEVLGRLRDLDQTRAHSASGTRRYEAALLGARSAVTRNLSDPSRHPTAHQGLARLKAMRVEHADDYVAAVIVARALIDLGWAERGGEHGKVSPDGLNAFRARFAEAEDVLEGFEPIEWNSPMLAEARYLLAPGIDGGLKFLRDWYEDWADLDPSNPGMLEAHARYLMPNWYGTFGEIDRAARKAAQRARKDLGAGAYTWFWLTPLAREDALTMLDADLFMEGVHEILSRSGDQRLANLFAARLYRLGHRTRGRARRGAHKAFDIRNRLAKGFEEVVRLHLREVQTMNWSTDDAGIRTAIARVFSGDLDKGAVVRPGKGNKGGLEANYPPGEDEE